MDDYISRKALLTAASGYDWAEGLKTVLKRIPAADVRPRGTGRWVDGGKSAIFPDDVIYRCSECGYRYFMMHHYCPNCGADMREAAPTIIPADPGEEVNE